MGGHAEAIAYVCISRETSERLHAARLTWVPLVPAEPRGPPTRRPHRQNRLRAYASPQTVPAGELDRSTQVNRKSDGTQQTVQCLTSLMKNYPEAERTNIDQVQPNKRSLHLIFLCCNMSSNHSKN